MLSLLEDLSPHARVATAVAPFAIAIALRVVLGRNRLTRMLISLGTMWFAINVLMAPYSARMTQDIRDLQYMFR
ncbi:hypothetical protein SBA4_5740003 [Candidatus Sulfopaludibacter sp. SbA4]|nr:hypothetical protein SBA4_5740003 [Candidatus Sulfopaludibacter sp. SbA4]